MSARGCSSIPDFPPIAATAATIHRSRCPLPWRTALSVFALGKREASSFSAPELAKQATREELTMELRSTRRIVTGHDKDGKAVALYDAPLKAIQRSAGGNGMTLCWVTSEFPVDMASAADLAQTKVGVPPPSNGTIFRIVDFAPTPTGGYGAVDHHQILINMGIDPATQGYARHENTHRTRTIDYAIVLEGEYKKQHNDD